MRFQLYPLEGLGQHIRGGHVNYGQAFPLDTVADKVVPRVDVLRARVVFGVLGKSLGALVIDMKR
jgi:homoserine acetyltransferase